MTYELRLRGNVTVPSTGRKKKMSRAEIKSVVKSFIIGEFLRGEPDDSLTDNMPLISTGIVDSMGSLRLVAFLEESFDVTLRDALVDTDHLDTLDMIVDTVMENTPRG